MTVILTPMEFSGTETLARRLYRKKVLPVGSIQYNGRRIDFTTESLNEMAASFNDGAFDNVPLQFAGDTNSHTNDVERYRGDVVAMGVENDGLYVTVAATPDGAKVLEENPRLGISARIVNEYDRSDGKHYRSAIQHVLATHDPRIPGLGGWETVENYSNDDVSDIIDLTAEKFTVLTSKETQVPKPDDDNSGLNDAELTRLREFLAELDEAPEDSADDSELTDAELAALVAEVEAEDAPAAEVTPEAEVETREPIAALSTPTDNAALELANTQATELSRMRTELDETRWVSDRDALMRETHLPPAVLDLAAPLLKGTGRTVELSNGDNADAGQIMRDVLTEVGKLAKLLDLSNELGTAQDAPDTSSDADANRDKITKAVRGMMGN